eukprot:GILJ01005453.1.p1 GENE.GILJ01005453.1~~GILJ01005453.1.p1  ORF type:complete len:731 (+),score=75.13 GILJ01005453.1:46-2238(+)
MALASIFRQEPVSPPVLLKVLHSAADSTLRVSDGTFCADCRLCLEGPAFQSGDTIAVSSFALGSSGICLLAANRVDQAHSGAVSDSLHDDSAETNLTFLHTDLDAFRYMTSTSAVGGEMSRDEAGSVDGNFVERAAALFRSQSWGYYQEGFCRLQVLEVCEMSVGLYRLWMSDGKWCFPVSLHVVKGGQLQQWLQTGKIKALTVVSTNIPFRGEIDDVNNMLIPLFDAATVLGAPRHVKELALEKLFIHGRLECANSCEYRHVTKSTTADSLSASWLPAAKALCLSPRVMDILSQLSAYQLSGACMSDMLLEDNPDNGLAMVLVDLEHVTEDSVPWPLLDAFVSCSAENQWPDNNAGGMLSCVCGLIQNRNPAIHFNLDLAPTTVRLSTREDCAPTTPNGEPSAAGSVEEAVPAELLVKAEGRLRRQQEVVKRLQGMWHLFEQVLLSSSSSVKTKTAAVEVLQHLPMFRIEGCVDRLIRFVEDTSDPRACEWRGALLACLAVDFNRLVEVRRLLVRYLNDSTLMASVTFRLAVFTPMYVLKEMDLVPAALSVIRRHLCDLQRKGGVHCVFGYALIPRLTDLGTEGQTIVLEYFDQIFAVTSQQDVLRKFLVKANVIPSVELELFNQRNYLSPFMFLLLRGIVRHHRQRTRPEFQRLLGELHFDMSLEDMLRVVQREENWRRRRLAVLLLLSSVQRVTSATTAACTEVDEVWWCRVRQLGPGLMRAILMFV